jgi:FKBP-type peptidyl-prolyl cis-trans isomerase
MYIRDTTVGTGAPAESGKQLTMQYTGFLVDGTQFDASPPSGFQFQLGVGEVIQGWELGVGPPGAMNVGGARQLIIPPSLGYGSDGRGTIPGNAILVFNVTMVSTP